MFGLLVPGLCILAVGFLTDMLTGMLVGIATEVVGIGATIKVGSNLDDAPDAVINLMPLVSLATGVRA